MRLGAQESQLCANRKQNSTQLHLELNPDKNLQGKLVHTKKSSLWQIALYYDMHLFPIQYLNWLTPLVLLLMRIFDETMPIFNLTLSIIFT